MFNVLWSSGTLKITKIKTTTANMSKTFINIIDNFNRKNTK